QRPRRSLSNVSLGAGPEGPARIWPSAPPNPLPPVRPTQLRGRHSRPRYTRSRCTFPSSPAPSSCQPSHPGWERCPRFQPPPFGLPDSTFRHYTATVVFRHTISAISNSFLTLIPEV